MPEIPRVASRFDQIYSTITGQKFFGRMVKVPDGNPTSITPQKRLLRVGQRCIVAVGDIIFDHEGLRYILAEGTTAMHAQSTVARTFRLVPADALLLWERPSPVVDPVTQLVKGDAKQNLGMIYGHLEPRDERLERTPRTTGLYEKWRFITPAPVAREDLLDGGRMRIERVERVAGLYMAEVQ